VQQYLHDFAACSGKSFFLIALRKNHTLTRSSGKICLLIMLVVHITSYNSGMIVHIDIVHVFFLLVAPSRPVFN
jgi:hypothetical protein